MRALDPRPARGAGSNRGLLALALLALLAAGLAAAGAGGALLIGVLVALGVLALAAARRGGRRRASLFSWQQVQIGMERELRRSLRRRRWRRRLHLGTPIAGRDGAVDQKTSA